MGVNNDKMKDDGIDEYPARLLEMARREKYFGRMNAPTSSAYIKGPCGDEMELYLVIEDNVINEIKFYTEGCIATRVCGEAVCELAAGGSIDEALAISPAKVINMLNGLPADHCHCSILAVSALYRAVADHLLKP